MADDAFMDAGSLQVADDGEPSAGKYFQVAVPRYSGDEGDMHCFLRMGKNAADVGQETHSKIGKELWAIFDTFYDTGAGPAGQVRARAPGGDPINGPRPPEADFGQSDDAAELFANAGWRDHCDGNRITTTGGDKVEIIRGNYQMIVLGRQPELGGSVINDRSGGHDTTSVIAPGNMTRVEWVQNFDGTWKITEEVEKGDVHEIFRGDAVEEFFGGRQISTTGGFVLPGGVDPGPTMTYDPVGIPPVIASGTHALKIHDYTGTAAQPVPEIHEETHALEVSDITTAMNVTSTTTIAGSVTETTEVAGSLTETLTAATVNSTTNANVNESFTGATNSTYLGASSESYLGVQTSQYLGAKSEFALAAAFALYGGVKVEIDVGLVSSTKLAGCFDINASKGFQATFGGLTELNWRNDDIAQIKSELTQLKSQISVNRNCISQLHWLF